MDSKRIRVFAFDDGEAVFYADSLKGLYEQLDLFLGEDAIWREDFAPDFKLVIRFEEMTRQEYEELPDMEELL